MSRGALLLSKNWQVWPPCCSPKQRGTPNKEPGALNSCSGSFIVPLLVRADKPQSQSMVVPGVYLPISRTEREGEKEKERESKREKDKRQRDRDR